MRIFKYLTPRSAGALRQVADSAAAFQPVMTASRLTKFFSVASNEDKCSEVARETKRCCATDSLAPASHDGHRTAI
jgi:hypothetical protein